MQALPYSALQRRRRTLRERLEGGEQAAEAGGQGRPAEQGGDAGPVDAPLGLEHLDHHRPGRRVAQGHAGQRRRSRRPRRIRAHRPPGSGPARRPAPSGSPPPGSAPGPARRWRRPAPAGRPAPPRPRRRARPAPAGRRGRWRPPAARAREITLTSGKSRPSARITAASWALRGLGDGDLAQVRALEGRRGRGPAGSSAPKPPNSTLRSTATRASISRPSTGQRDRVADLQPPRPWRRRRPWPPAAGRRSSPATSGPRRCPASAGSAPMRRHADVVVVGPALGARRCCPASTGWPCTLVIRPVTNGARR